MAATRSRWCWTSRATEVDGIEISCEVGEEARPPTIQSPIDNLLFVGDVVSIAHTVEWMEKTNVTAKWVTNLLLERAGQKECRVTILPSAMLGLPGLILDAQRQFGAGV